VLHELLNKKTLNIVFLIVFLILFARIASACTSDSDCPVDGYYCSGGGYEYRNYYCNLGSGTCSFSPGGYTSCSDGLDCSADWCWSSGGNAGCGHCTRLGYNTGSCSNYGCCYGCYSNHGEDSGYCMVCDLHNVQLTEDVPGYLKCESSCGASSACDEQYPYTNLGGSYCNKDCQQVSGSPPSCPANCPNEGSVPATDWWCCASDCARYNYLISITYDCGGSGGSCRRTSTSGPNYNERYATQSCTVCQSGSFQPVDSSNYCNIGLDCLDLYTCLRKYFGCQIGQDSCDTTTTCDQTTQPCPTGQCCIDGVCDRCPCGYECENPFDFPPDNECCPGLLQDTSAPSPICIACNNKLQASTSNCNGPNLCEKDCGAITECDEKASSSLLNYCNKAGTTWFRDNCRGSPACSGADADSICKSSGSVGSGDGCTASTQCNNHQINTCSDQSGYCGSSCAYQTAETSSEACNCDVCGVDNRTAPNCLISDANENPWDVSNWKGDITQKCCGNDANEFTKNPVCLWNCSSQLGAPVKSMSSCGGRPDLGNACYRINLKACCNNVNDCVWKSGGAEACYSNSTTIKNNLGNNITCVEGTWYDVPSFSDGFSDGETVFYFSGDLNYFNNFWTLNYPYLKRSASVKCALNCDPSKISCPANSQCIPYPYKQDPGKGTCAVPNPIYNFSVPNSVGCLVYDTNLPQRVYSSYNYAFNSVNFDVSVPPTVAITVGQSFSLPINLKNIGLLADDYTVELKTSTPNTVLIEGNTSIIPGLKTNSTGDINFRITLLASGSASVTINVTSLVSCRYSPQGCLSKSVVLTLQGGVNNLPDFDSIGVLQIVAISAILVFVSFKKVKAHSKQ